MANVRYPMMIINFALPLVLKLVPNPIDIKISSQKIYSSTRTLDGYVYEHWGNAPDTISVSGITNLINDASRRQIENAFYQLRSLYKLDKTTTQSIIGRLLPQSKVLDNFINGTLTDTQIKSLQNTIILYKNNIYKGFFTRFDWIEDGNRPNTYIYNFEYLATTSMEDYIRNTAFVPFIDISLQASSGITSLVGGTLEGFGITKII